MLDFEKHYKMKAEPDSISFVEELDKMLEGKDQSWFGTAARLSLW